MTSQDTCVVVLNAGYQVIGFLEIQNGQVSGEPVVDFAIEFEVLAGERARVLQLPEVGAYAQGSAQVGLVDVPVTHPRALEALVETLRREGVLAHLVPTVLKPLLTRVNGLTDEGVRKEALSYLLYIPPSQVGGVVQNFTDLQSLMARQGGKR